MDTLQTIIKHGLAIRRMPLSVTTDDLSTKTLKEGDEIIFTCGDWYRVKRTTITKKHGGWWMCKPFEDTSKTINWFKETDNLAPTLEESVELFLKNLKNA